MTLEGDDQGTRLVAQMQFGMAKPTFEFSLKIFKDKLYVHAMLHNAATLRIAFDAAVSDQFFHNHVWTLAGPSLTIPLAGPVPFNVDVRQDLQVTTAFSAKTSSFGAGGTYRLNADLGLSYSAGDWLVHGPKGLTVESPMVPTMTGVSFGPEGMILRHELTLTAGLGDAGFTVGPVFILSTALGVAQGSTVGIVQCREAALSMHARASVGYTIPRPVAKFINFFLRLFHVTEIKDHDSIATPWQQLFTPIRVKPGGQSCVAETAPPQG